MSQPARRTRLTPRERKEQLLDHGVRLLGTRQLDELSIDLLAEEAGISRGLLYHYFGGKHDFHVAVVERAAREIFEATAPTGDGDALTQMLESMRVYVRYVRANHTGYASLVRAARGGSDDLRGVYERARGDLTDRIFAAAGAGALAELGITDTTASRRLARAWASMAEDAVLDWVLDDAGLSEDQLITSLTSALWAGLTSLPRQA
ncbi:TetR/AcrR family transcriptional regulator [Nocardioidaceae bacterium]|nr:TetR/AcrR family transcriptional regulator [Nocardioidaceae bacterium]